MISNEAVNNEIMMTINDNLESTPNVLEMATKDIVNDDIENGQEPESGDIAQSTSTDNIRNSLHQLSSIHNENFEIYDNNDDTDNDHYHEECLICCEEYIADEIVVLLPQCRHMYHAPCLEQWFIYKKSNLCPLCKTPIIVEIEKNIMHYCC